MRSWYCSTGVSSQKIVFVLLVKNATNSFLIESSGPLTLESNCFLDNALGVSAAVVYGAPIEASNNYGFNSTGGRCEFAAIFETELQLQNFTPQCLNFDATSCQASLLATAAPAYPSDSPSISPSQFPTTTPSSGPSETPTIGPSSGPSSTAGIPSVSPSSISLLSPSQIPSLFPSFFPSDAPTKPRSRPSPKHSRTQYPTPAPSNVTSAAFGKLENEVWLPMSTLACVMMLFG